MADRATWVKRVGAWRASGQTAARFCEGRDFSVGSLRFWSSRLGRSSPETVQPAIRMARVVRRTTAVRARDAAGGSIVLELGGARVAIGAGFDRDALVAVLDVLESRGHRGAR